MQVVRTVAEMREVRRSQKGRVGFVATLGGIHVGHTTHMDIMRPLCDVMIGSLFLNPTQFGESEDLSSYPAVEADDLAQFEAHGTDIVFAPSVDEMYPPGGIEQIEPGPIANVLEGAHRPGHFDGVATVVNRLFDVVGPDIASFGEKDAQQLRIIEQLIVNQGFEIEVVRIPTVREADGLAVSSRNQYLSADERRAACVLYRSMNAAKQEWRNGERSSENLKQLMTRVLDSEPLADTQYATIVDPHSFNEVGIANPPVRAVLAARIGKARLIDNMLFD